MNNITVRKASLNDAEAINLLNIVSLGYDYPLEKAKLALERVLALDGHIVFVAEANEKVLGYVHAQDYSTLYADNMKNILGIAVDPAAQNMGIGKMLLEAAESWAKNEGSSGIRLTSGEKRAAAHKFYEKAGYENGGAKIAFYKKL